MPAIIPFIPAIVGAIALEYGVIAAAAAALVASIPVGDYQRRRAQRKARDAFNASLRDRLVMTAVSDAARGRCYGRVRNCDGVIFKATHGTQSEFYTLVLALSAGEIDAVEQIWLNDIVVHNESPDAPSSAPLLSPTGYVQVAPYLREDFSSEFATIQIVAGNGSVALANEPIEGSVWIYIVTNPGTDAAEVTHITSFAVEGSTVTVTDAIIDGLASVVYQAVAGTQYVRIRPYLGVSGQDISAELDALVPTLINTGQHRFDKIALLLATLEYTQDAFPAGVPQITAVVRGAKCLDPRDDSVAWTENPALIALDWAMYEFGGNLSADEIDIQSFIDAANACDVPTTFNVKYIRDGDEVIPIEVEEPRYICGIVAKTDANAGDVFEEIIASMAGQYGWSGGKLRVRAGTYTAPVATVTESWASGKEPISIQPATGMADTYNVLRPTISDKDRDYVITPIAQIRADAYVTADGQELPSEITLSGVTSGWHAQDICEVMLLEGRQAMTATLPLNMRAFALELFDVIEVTLPAYGWTAKTFEVRVWRFSAFGGIVLLLREIAATSYDPATLFTLEDLADNTELPKPWVVDPVEGLMVTSGAFTETAQIVTRTLVTWNLHSQAAVRQNGRIEIQFVDTGELGPQFVRWVNDLGEEVIWLDDDGTGAAWFSADGSVPVILEWVNDNGVLLWENDIETTLEWYVDVFRASVPAGDWQAIYEPGGSTSHLIVGLSPGHSFLFRARAINSIGVRSIWSTQISIVIPIQPLVQTTGIAQGSMTEVITTVVETDTWTTTIPSIQDRKLGQTSYYNTSGGVVTIEFSLASQRRVTTPTDTLSLDVVAFLSIVETGDGLPGGGILVGPLDDGISQVENMGPGESRTFTESHVWSLELDDGHSVAAESILRTIPGASVVGIEIVTSNLALRMTVIKR